MLRKTKSLITLIFTLTFILLTPFGTHAQEFLTKPIEFVIHSGAGGGTDTMARMLHSIIEKERIMTHPIACVNRPGAGGVIAFTYVAEKKGDPHYWLTTTTSFIATPLLGKSKYNYKDFTPLAQLCYDSFFVAVRADSPYKSMKDLIEAAKKKPGEIKSGGTYEVGTDAFAFHLIEKAAGVKFNYIPFKSGGKVMIALLGGHIDVAVPNPSKALSHVEAKKMRVLGFMSEKRMEQAPDIPTLREQGINAVWTQFRAIAAPKNIPQEAIKYYEDVFKKAVNSSSWKEKYIKENMLTWDYKASAETYKVWEGENEKLAKIMKEMGVIK